MAEYDLGTARGRIEIDSSGVESGLDRSNKAVAGFGGGLDKAAGTLVKTGVVLGGVGALAVAGFGVAVNAAANFEERISAIGAVSNATGEQLDAVRKQALQLGADTKFSAGEAAQAMENLVKGGLSVEQTLGGAAKSVTDLAAATDSSLETSSELVATAVSAFKLQADEVPRIADVITGAVNSYVRSGDEFRLALSQSAAVAKTVGLSFDDLALGINAMASAGIHGSDAGTSLKTMFLNLQPTTKKQTQLFQELGLLTEETGPKLTRLGGQALDSSTLVGKLGGASDDVKKKLAAAGIEVDKAGNKFTDGKGKTLDYTKVIELLTGKAGLTSKQIGDLGLEVSKGGNAFFDAQGKVKSMTDVAGVLQNALKGMTEQQKLSTLETLFGTDAIRAGAVMADLGAQGLGKLNDEMGKTTAAETAKKRMDNLKGSMEQLKGSVETALISIGSMGQGPLKFLVDILTKVVNGFVGLPDPVKQFLIVATLIAGVLVGAAGGFILVVGGAIKLAGAMKDAKMAFESIKAAGGIINSIKAAMAGQAAATNAATAATARHTISQTVAAGATKVWTAAQWLFNAAMSANPLVLIIIAIMAVVAAVILAYNHFEGFRNVIDAIGRAVAAAFGWLIDMGSKVVGFFVDNWPKILAILFPFIGIPLLIIKNWEVIAGFFNRVWDAVWGFFSDFIGKIIGFHTKIIGIAIDIGQKFFSAIIDHFKKVFEGAVNILGDLIGFVAGIPGKILGALGDFGSMLWEKGKDLILGLIRGIGSMAGAIKDALVGLLPGPLKQFANVLGLASPSKLFAGFGRDTVAGYIMGLEAKEKALDKAMNRIADKSISGGVGNVPPVLASMTRGGAPAISAPAVTISGGTMRNVPNVTLTVEATFNFGPGSNADDLRNAWNNDIEKKLADSIESVVSGVLSGAGSR